MCELSLAQVEAAIDVVSGTKGQKVVKKQQFFRLLKELERRCKHSQRYTHIINELYALSLRPFCFEYIGL